MASCHIVVARYQENIDWLNPVLQHCIILNKGDPLNISAIQHPLPNVGREAHSYLWYIIKYYDSLPDICIFTQGNIRDHREGDPLHYLMKMGFEAYLNGKSNIPFTSSATDIYHGKVWNLLYDSMYLPQNYMNGSIAFGDWFQHLIKPEFPDPIQLYGNALMAIRKEYILKKPKKYYEMLINHVQYTRDPIEAHFFERSWNYIFS